MAYDAEWINQLDETTPLGTESRSLGDNAIREIKRVLKESFPAAVASDPLTVPFSTLNTLATVGPFPRDSLMLWAGDTVALPNGPDPTQWTICDGRARASGGFSPNLVNRFIIGAKVPTTSAPPAISHAIGTFGGSTEINITQYGTSTSVPFGTDPTVLTDSQVPAHSHVMFSHEYTDNSESTGLTSSNSPTYWWSNSNEYSYVMAAHEDLPAPTVGKTSSFGGGLGHSHFFTIRTNPAVTTWANVPPYFAAVWLIKE